MHPFGSTHLVTLAVVRLGLADPIFLLKLLRTNGKCKAAVCTVLLFVECWNCFKIKLLPDFSEEVASSEKVAIGIWESRVASDPEYRAVAIEKKSSGYFSLSLSERVLSRIKQQEILSLKAGQRTKVSPFVMRMKKSILSFSFSKQQMSL